VHSPFSLLSYGGSHILSKLTNLPFRPNSKSCRPPKQDSPGPKWLWIVRTVLSYDLEAINGRSHKESIILLLWPGAMGVQEIFYVCNPSNIVGPNGSLNSQVFNEKVQNWLSLLYSTTQQSCGRFIKFSGTAIDRSDGLCCYEGNQTNLFFLFSIPKICEDPASVFPSRSAERSAGLCFGTAATVVAFGRGALGTQVCFAALVLTVSRSEVTLLY